MRTRTLVPFILILTGCAGNDPLIFVSSNAVGIDLNAGTSSQPLTVTFGYKGNDTSIVPVSVLDKNGGVHEIRGCETESLGTGTVTPCPAQGVVSTTTTSPTGASLVGAPLDASELRSIRHTPSLVRTTGLAMPMGTTNGAQSMRDALSVYSSFNNGLSASNGTTNGVGAGISLGKVFATGIAAQELTQGQNYLLQQSGATQCIAQLVTAMGTGKVTETALSICKAK